MIKKSHDDLRKIFSKSGSEIPDDIESMIAELYIRKTKVTTDENKQSTIEIIQNAIEIYKTILNRISEIKYPIRYGDVKVKLGDAYYQLAQHTERESNTRDAIKSYIEASPLFDYESFPDEYKIIRNNLGNAYQILAEFENENENLDKAATCYEEGLKHDKRVRN